MLKVKKLYRPFQLSKSYEDINEEQILSSLYAYQAGTIEMVISRIINDAVLNHMHLCIDSTIMQILALNEYLSELFMMNLESLMFNYLIYALEYQGVEEIEEETVTKVMALAQSVTMKTELHHLLNQLEQLIKEIE